MADLLLTAFRHNAWANRGLLEYCRDLGTDQLNTNVPGVYGSPLATLKHILGAGAFYRSLFSGAFPDWDWRDEEVQPLEELESWAEDMASFWEELLSRPLDADKPLSEKRRDGSEREIPASLMLVQAMHLPSSARTSDARLREAVVVRSEVRPARFLVFEPIMKSGIGVKYGCARPRGLRRSSVPSLRAAYSEGEVST